MMKCLIKNRFARLFQYSLNLLFILLLAHCAALPTVKQARSPDEFSANRKNEALIVVSGVVNTGEVNQISYLRLQSLDAPLVKGKPNPAPPEYLLNTVNSGKSKNISLLVGSVPSGRYKVSEINFGGRYLDLKTNKGLSDLEFQANGVYDLGMIILTAANARVLVGLSSQFPDNQQLIKRYLPANDLLKDAKVGGWIETSPKKDPIAEYFALSHPQGLSNLVESLDGEIFAGSRMGTVVARNTSGKWRIVGRTGTYDQITLVIPNPEGAKDSTYAFTENGDTFLLESDKVTKVEMGNFPKGQVFFLQHNAQRTRWFVGVTHDKKSELLTANSLNGQWEVVYSENVEFSAWSGARNVWTGRLPNGFVFASTNSSDVRCYDFQSEKWTLTGIPKKRVLLDLKTNPKTGAIGILTGPGGGFGGAFATPFFSNQCGAGWTEIKSPYTVQVAAPIPLNDSSIAEIGGVFGDAGIYVSTDNAATWKKQSDKAIMVERFFQTISNGLFVVSSGASGFEQVFNSKDNGSTWQLELSSFDQRLNTK